MNIDKSNSLFVCDEVEVIDCPIANNLTKKCETYVMLTEKRRWHNVQRIKNILDKVRRQDNIKDIDVDHLHEAFCYSFRNDLTDYFEPLLSSWPKEKLSIKLPEELDDYVNLQDIAEDLLTLAIKLMDCAIKLRNEKKLRNLRLISFTQLPVFFNESTVRHLTQSAVLLTTAHSDLDFGKLKYLCFSLNVFISSWDSCQRMDQYRMRIEKFNTTIEIVSVRLSNMDLSEVQSDAITNVMDYFGLDISAVTNDYGGLSRVRISGRENDFSDFSIIEFKNDTGLKIWYTPQTCAKGVDLCHNNLCNDLMYHIPKTEKLESLQLKNCSLSAIDLSILRTSLYMYNLKHLDLSSNCFGNEKNLSLLLKIIEAVKLKLETLALVDIEVNHKAMEKIGEVIVRSCQQLRFLNVALNPGANYLLTLVLECIPGIRAFLGTFEESEDITISEFIENMHIFLQKACLLPKVYIRDTIR